jgi:D-3-phosphoglycerate dehydrogenase
MDKPVVFVPEPIARAGMELLRTGCECLAPWEAGGGTEIDRALLRQADAVIVRLFKITAQDLDGAPRLKVISKHGAGVDNIDVRAATAHHIPVVYTPDATTMAVAEHTLALLLALCRQVVPASQALQAGLFSQRGRFQGVELAGKTLGVIGLGRIGARVAYMVAMGLEMMAVAYDPYLPKDSYEGPAILLDSLEALLARADFVTLHIPLTPDTQHLINPQTLQLMKPGARLINTSRGAVVDEAALVRALQQGRLAGAALDVFQIEPLPADHPLVRAPNILLTPHIASSTGEALERMALQAAQGILDVWHGHRPEYLANPEVFG